MHLSTSCYFTLKVTLATIFMMDKYELKDATQCTKTNKQKASMKHAVSFLDLGFVLSLGWFPPMKS